MVGFAEWGLALIGFHQSESKADDEDLEKHFDLTFKGAISSLYTLLPSLPPLVGDTRPKVRPISVLPSDFVKEDTSLYRFFSTIYSGFRIVFHRSIVYWWDLPSDKVDLSHPKGLPPNASPLKTLGTPSVGVQRRLF